ncbi:hypothetical protein DOTSEDRAFT_76676 [Dothistroma septosporum NZE10]|uniref:Secreted protein n=1 Tax=Dothistroma septosporum (strain NZE10 / CBS 128990) TaxID=675120 RepID=N1Q0N5_DOTSN|nr:hypothetical protein DOTSEDRAFT_76676 [Dothistroma septosporum NZE10]
MLRHLVILLAATTGARLERGDRVAMHRIIPRRWPSLTSSDGASLTRPCHDELLGEDTASVRDNDWKLFTRGSMLIPRAPVPRKRPLALSALDSALFSNANHNFSSDIRSLHNTMCKRAAEDASLSTIGICRQRRFMFGRTNSAGPIAACREQQSPRRRRQRLLAKRGRPGSPSTVMMVRSNRNQDACAKVQSRLPILQG